MLEAETLTEILTEKQLPFVLAESCTGGMVAAFVTQVPGVSQIFCGSLVSYRIPSKIAWLGVDKDLIVQESAESQAVASAMAQQALVQTTEAKIAAAITGDLGPNVSSKRDGACYMAIAERSEGDSMALCEKAIRLRSESRVTRQHEAAVSLLRFFEQYVRTNA